MQHRGIKIILTTAINTCHPIFIRINYFLVINALFFIVFLHSASAREAEGRDAGCGDRGVRLGLHPAHRHLGLHAEQRPCRPLRQTQRGRSDHGCQRHQSGGPAAHHLSGHHQGLDISKHVFNTYQLLSAFITYFVCLCVCFRAWRITFRWN